MWNHNNGYNYRAIVNNVRQENIVYVRGGNIWIMWFAVRMGDKCLMYIYLGVGFFFASGQLYFFDLQFRI